MDLAADAFGQGTDLVNPLSQATVAAAIEDGTWRRVTSPAPRQADVVHPLGPAILDSLRPMMRAVVTSGTAAGVGFPPGVYGKTGTARYGTGPNPPSHGWFIGYRGDLAFRPAGRGRGHRSRQRGPDRQRVPAQSVLILPAKRAVRLGAVSASGRCLPR